ncbi:MAG: hypothetical protein SFZ23_07745 [Planctomycetota bacterium]|nr:hypothetical protein [Planctomycetota bacterium]
MAEVASNGVGQAREPGAGERLVLGFARATDAVRLAGLFPGVGVVTHGRHAALVLARNVDARAGRPSGAGACAKHDLVHAGAFASMQRAIAIRVALAPARFPEVSTCELIVRYLRAAEGVLAASLERVDHRVELTLSISRAMLNRARVVSDSRGGADRERGCAGQAALGEEAREALCEDRCEHGSHAGARFLRSRRRAHAKLFGLGEAELAGLREIVYGRGREVIEARVAAMGTGLIESNVGADAKPAPVRVHVLVEASRWSSVAREYASQLGLADATSEPSAGRAAACCALAAWAIGSDVHREKGEAGLVTGPWAAVHFLDPASAAGNRFLELAPMPTAASGQVALGSVPLGSVSLGSVEFGSGAAAQLRAG